jgi:multidrug efflux system outer membrane protein
VAEEVRSGSRSGGAGPCPPAPPSPRTSGRPLLAVALLAAGCRIGPEYVRPDLDVPAAHRDAAGPATQESVADVPWWELYRDPALAALLDEAVANNHDLRIAVARVEESRAFASLVRSARMPRVSGLAGVSREQASRELSPDGDRRSTRWDAGVGASWEIDLFGQVRRAEEAALADLAADEEVRRDVLTALVADVASAFVDLRELDRELEIARRTLETREKTRDLFVRRDEGGFGTRLEVAQAEADVADTAATIPEIERSVTLAENRIALLVGRNPGPIARTFPPAEFPVPADVLAGVPAAVLERRPDVRSAEERVRAATARLGAAQAAFYPTVSLAGLLGLASDRLSDLVGHDAVAWDTAARGAVPLFTGGALDAREAAARAVVEQEVEAYRFAAQRAFREVADALVSIRRLREVRVQNERLVAAQQESLDLALARYEGGLSAYFEVLDAQRALFPAQIRFERTKRDHVLAVIECYRALGGGALGEGVRTAAE